ncbi:hypothetical protein GOBAR_AA06953 [Gossypium barbadense]|uniref:CCHC-type domain-containing protein n=1 Tax=Gossypium barbadense TaxID=3634 RepID=A0A2P5YDL0_GOSBA|nr:hypothetical protein GOBAR_AA06953 [Gossypium barbadense]
MENSLHVDGICSLPKVEDGGGLRADDDRNTKKVRFKEDNNGEITDMLVETRSSPSITWKDKLLGINSGYLDKKGLVSSGYSADEDLEFLEGDIHRSMVNGIPAIDFSERIQQILYKEMEQTVVLKLLGRNISYGALNTRISRLWNPSMPFHLMDIENGYFLAKFQSPDDYAKDFIPSQAYPSMVLAWIRLSGLLRFLYKRRILEEIGRIIGKVVQLDFNTDSRTRGRFARMVVYINLDKPLIAQVLVNGLHQQVEYEALPTICFNCGKYGHTKELCVTMQPGSSSGKEQISDILIKVTNDRDEGAEGQAVDFGDSLKSGTSMVQLRKNNRGKEQIEGIKKNFGPEISKECRTTMDGPIVPHIAASAEANGVLSPDGAKSIMATCYDGPSQFNGVLNWPSTKSDSQVDILGGFSKSLSGPDISTLIDAKCFNPSTSFSNSSNMNISCFNPVFIGHEDNDGDVLDKQTKTDSMVPKLVEIQVTDSIGGLNPLRHTVVSFNKKESVGGDHLRKKNATNSGGTKSRTLGTVVNKDGGFGAIKKINKITHGKGINFKNKISSKVPLSDSMSRLAQTVSILQGDISEVVGPDSGKSIQE